jgi:hypothetical protein
MIQSYAASSIIYNSTEPPWVKRPLLAFSADGKQLAYTAVEDSRTETVNLYQPDGQQIKTGVGGCDGAYAKIVIGPDFKNVAGLCLIFIDSTQSSVDVSQATDQGYMATGGDQPPWDTIGRSDIHNIGISPDGKHLLLINTYGGAYYLPIPS